MRHLKQIHSPQDSGNSKHALSPRYPFRGFEFLFDNFLGASYYSLLSPQSMATIDR